MQFHHVLRQFFEQKALVEHQPVAWHLAPAHLGVDRGEARRLDAHRLAQHQPFGAFDTGALLRNVAQLDRDSAPIGVDRRIAINTQADLAFGKLTAIILDQPLDIDVFVKVETGVIVAAPLHFHRIPLAAAGFERHRPMRRQGMEQANLAPRCRNIAQNAQIFTPIRDQLGRADHQRKARRTAEIRTRRLPEGGHQRRLRFCSDEVLCQIFIHQREGPNRLLGNKPPSTACR